MHFYIYIYNTFFSAPQREFVYSHRPTYIMYTRYTHMYISIYTECLKYTIPFFKWSISQWVKFYLIIIIIIFFLEKICHRLQFLFYSLIFVISIKVLNTLQRIDSRLKYSTSKYLILTLFESESALERQGNEPDTLRMNIRVAHMNPSPSWIISDSEIFRIHTLTSIIVIII